MRRNCNENIRFTDWRQGDTQTEGNNAAPIRVQEATNEEVRHQNVNSVQVAIGKETVKISKDMYVPAVIGNHSFQCLLDTGASLNIIDRSVYEMIGGRIPNLKLRPSSTIAKGASGKGIAIHGDCTLEMALGRRRMMVEFSVAEILPEVILGMPFRSS